MQELKNSIRLNTLKTSKYEIKLKIKTQKKRKSNLPRIRIQSISFPNRK